MSDELKDMIEKIAGALNDLVARNISIEEFDHIFNTLTLEAPLAPVDAPLPSVFPVIVDEDWRWSYNFNQSEWELQKHYAGVWHRVRSWTISGIFESPAATREHVQKVLNKCGVNFTQRPLIEPDPELERLLQEEEEIERQLKNGNRIEQEHIDEDYVEGL